MPVLRATARESSTTDEPTDPVAGGGQDGTPAPDAPAGPAPVETAPEGGGEQRHTLREMLFRRAIVLPIVCVLAVVVGFVGMTVLLSGTDEPAKSDTKPTVTTTTAPAPAPLSTVPRPAVAPRPPAEAVPEGEDSPAAPPPPPPVPSSTPEPPASTTPAPTTSVPPTSTTPTTTPEDDLRRGPPTTAP